MKALSHIALMTFLFVSTSCKTPEPESQPAAVVKEDNVRFKSREIWAQRMGIRFQGDTLKVQVVETASFAAVIGLKSSDTVLKLNDVAVTTATNFEEIANRFARNNPRPWKLRIERQNVTTPIDLTPLAKFECDAYALIGCGDLPNRP